MIGLFKNFYYFCLFLGILFGVFVCTLAHTMFVCAFQKRISDLLGLKLQPVVNHLMWVLGTEFGSFRETENTHNYWTIFPHHFCFEICVQVCAWMWVYAHGCSAKRSQKRAVDSPRAGFKGILCWKLNVDPPAEADAVLPTDQLYSHSPPRLGLTV